jgi:hypothetical protein
LLRLDHHKRDFSFCLDYQLAVGHAELHIALLSWDS